MSTSVIERTMQLPSDQDSSGRTFGDEELAALTEAIASGVLTSTRGKFVHQFEQDFAKKLGIAYAHACSSGTAAIHAAIAAIDPEPGDEIITSPITDMGAITPILYQAAIPVFADVDPATCNLTRQSIESCLSDRTRAIIVTHLFGQACEMGEIMELARSRRIQVIEDCSQAFLTRYEGRFAGTFGSIGCFSLQQGKHITAGEGGLVISNDPALARRIFLFVNKAWGYGDRDPDHYFLALNYRMSELQGAVAAAQLPKLELVVARRVAAARRFSELLDGVPGLALPQPKPGSVHTYWKFCPRVNSEVIPGGAVALARELKAKGICSLPRYIQKPAFMCRVFQQRKTFGESQFPFTLARTEALRYDPSHFPLAMQALESLLVLPWNENYTQQHLEYLATSIADSVSKLRSER